MTTEELTKTALRVLAQRGLRICTAESCTGGLLGKLFTDIPGSSAVYAGGVISYTNAVKHNVLGVRQETLDRYTAVSAETAGEMARGVRGVIGAEIGVSVTGLAGPDGDGTGRPVGLVYIGYSDDRQTISRELRLSGSRTEIRGQAAESVLNMVLEMLG